MLIKKILKICGLSENAEERQAVVENVISTVSAMDEWKIGVLSKINIPTSMDPVAVINVLEGMKTEEIEIGGKPVLQLSFEDDADKNIIEVILDGVYGRIGVNKTNIVNFDVISSGGKVENYKHECYFKDFPDTCNAVLKNDPDSLLTFKSDLNIEDFCGKTNKKDVSWVRSVIVDGDFICSRSSKVFPYQVNGTFDCHGLGKDYITKEVSFPKTKKINCAYSIQDLGVLMGILPDDLETLVVEPKLIKKTTIQQNTNLFQQVSAFIDMYPCVNVIDIKGHRLQDTMVEIDNDINGTKQEKIYHTPVIKKAQKNFDAKINGVHLDVKELLAYCRTLPEYDSYSDDVLERLIRTVLSNQRKNGIEKKMMRRSDGINVVCIDAAQRDFVINDLSKLVTEREKTQEEQIVPLQNKEVVRPVATVVKPINIKKYIKPSQLKEVIKSSGKNNAYTALSAVYEINLDPLDMQFQGSVRIIKNEKEVVSATVKKESGCCLVQSIDSSNYDDAKRIVWKVADGPYGLILVCVGFCEHHNTKKASNKYESLRSMAYKKQKYTEQDLVKYLDIDELVADKDFVDTAADIDLSVLDSNLLDQKRAEVLGYNH